MTSSNRRTSQAGSLGKAFALAGTRYDQLCTSYGDTTANSENFFTEAFINRVYKKSVLDSLVLLRRVFTQNFVDFTGRPLIDETDLTLYLDNDTATANAWVLPTKTGGLEITTTLGLLIILDLLCAARWPHITEFFPDQPLPEPSFQAVCSPALTTIVQENLRSGLSDVAKTRLADFFSKPTREKREDWARVTTFTTLWVLSHEVGHYLCGHVGHYENQTGIIGLSERITNQLGPSISPSFTSGEVTTTWARELMADAYATIRLSLIICAEVAENRWDGSISEVLGLITTASTLPGVTFLLGPKEEQNSSILEASYPSDWCRVFGVFASVVFIVLPLPNTALDPRKNPIEQFWQDHLLSRADWKMFLIHMLDLFEGMGSYLNTMNLISFPQSEWNYVIEHLCGSLIGSRTGVVVSEENPIHADLLQWMYAMKLLCTRINAEFSWYLARSWLTGKGEHTISEDEIRGDLKELFGKNLKKIVKTLDSMKFTNDPAYKILDDWMSNIQNTWQAGADDIIQRQEECALIGKAIVQMRRSI